MTFYFSRFVLYCSVLGLLLSNVLPEKVYTFTVFINMFFGIFNNLALMSRVPQIMMNFREKNTGTLSLITSFLFFGGGVARTITIFIEVPDVL